MHITVSKLLLCQYLNCHHLCPDSVCLQERQPFTDQAWGKTSPGTSGTNTTWKATVPSGTVPSASSAKGGWLTNFLGKMFFPHQCHELFLPQLTFIPQDEVKDIPADVDDKTQKTGKWMSPKLPANLYLELRLELGFSKQLVRALRPPYQPEINWQSFPGLLGHLNLRMLIQRSKIWKYQAIWQVSQSRFDHRILPELLISPCLQKGSLGLKGRVIPVSHLSEFSSPICRVKSESWNPSTAASKPLILSSKLPRFSGGIGKERERFIIFCPFLQKRTVWKEASICFPHL